MSNPGNMTYDESDHPRMGTVRRASEKNELLIKPKLATVKRPTRDIPDDGFSYGMMYEEGDTVREAMIHMAHVANPHATKGNDIKAMNKLAPRMHFVRAEQQRPYRKEHPLKLKVKKRIAHVPPLPSKKNPDYVYGKPLIRGETADELLSYNFADDWIKMNEYHQHDYQFIKPQFVPPRSTKTVEARSDCCYQKYNPPPDKERFIINKFKSVPRRIDNVQTTPFLRDDRPPVFRNMKRRGGICGMQTAYCGDGDDYPSCGISGLQMRTRLPCSGLVDDTLLPRRRESGDVVCVAANGEGGGGKMLLPRFYKPCSSSDTKKPCSSHPRRSDPDESVSAVRREASLRGPRRSDPD